MTDVLSLLNRLASEAYGSATTLAGLFTSLIARCVALEGTTPLELTAATGDIAAHSLVTIALDTTAKFAYASTSALGLFGVSMAGGAAAAACTAIPWQASSTQTCRSTAAAIAVHDLVCVAASGAVVKVSAGAGKVVCGYALSSVGGGGGAIAIAPFAPYLTLS